MDISEIKPLHGTTTIGLVCSDGIVIGGDSRATMDTFIASKEAIKVYKINDKLGITIAGAVGDALYLVKVLKTQAEIYNMNENKLMSPGAAVSLLSIIMQENKMLPFMVELIIGGINSDEEEELYTIDALGGNIKESKFASTGSGSLTALGSIENEYKPNMNVQEGIKLALRALQTAMRRDAATGDNTTIATITKKGFKIYSKDELDKMIAKS